MAGLLLVALACAPYHSSGGPSERGPSYESSTFPWSGETLSWRKLELIEDWLASEEPSRRPRTAERARLELAEGRLALARSDQGRISHAEIQQRIETAQAEFRRVRTSAAATREDRARADLGLDDARRLLKADPRAVLPAPGATFPRGRPRTAQAPKSSAVGSKSRTILGRQSWGARAAVPNRLDRESGWRRITIHHSGNATRELGRQDLPSVSDALRRIQKFHIEENGWGDIGYHYLIDPKGRVFEGRKAAFQGAHAGDRNSNRNNVGICLLGNFDTERPTPAALATLTGLVDTIRKKRKIPRNQVFSHQDFKQTECPGRYLGGWIEQYKGGRLAGPQ